MTTTEILAYGLVYNAGLLGTYAYVVANDVRAGRNLAKERAANAFTALIWPIAWWVIALRLLGKAVGKLLEAIERAVLHRMSSRED